MALTGELSPSEPFTIVRELWFSGGEIQSLYHYHLLNQPKKLSHDIVSPAPDTPRAGLL